MDMSSLILDNEEKFFDTAESKASECETFNEFVASMKPHAELLAGTQHADEPIEDILGECWDEFWSKFAVIN